MDQELDKLSQDSGFSETAIGWSYEKKTEVDRTPRIITVWVPQWKQHRSTSRERWTQNNWEEKLGTKAGGEYLWNKSTYWMNLFQSLERCIFNPAILAKIGFYVPDPTSTIPYITRGANTGFLFLARCRTDLPWCSWEDCLAGNVGIFHIT